MKLTGKCKDDFEKQIDCIIFEEIPEACQNALIIEFFDSVGIYIQDWGFVDDVIGMKPQFDASINYNQKLYSMSSGFYNTRQESINQAIIEANKIYNNNQ